MRSLSLIFFFLIWKLQLPKASLSALITSYHHLSSVHTFAISRETAHDFLATCGKGDLKRGELTVMAQKLATPSAASDLGPAIQSVTSSSASSADICVGNVMILIPSKGAADTCRSKFGSRSPAGNPTVREAARHLAKKIDWFSDGLVNAKIATPEEVSQSVLLKNEAIVSTNCLIAFHLNSTSDLSLASELFQVRKNGMYPAHGDLVSQFALECDVNVDDSNGSAFKPLSSTIVGRYDSENPSIISKVLPWTKAASHRRLHQKMAALFERRDSDDFVLALMLFFDLCTPLGVNIPWVKHSIDATWEKGIVRNTKEFISMISKCGPCILKCLRDPQCSKCLSKLTALDTRDQVASYRTIVSYESDILRDFSLCILQKNNIFGCEATIPDRPYIPPVQQWKNGKNLTREDARRILIGHLDEGSEMPQVSWKVAAGANEAYDQFPSQNQLFYTGVNGGDMWYDPVFLVNTVDGRHVWCKRHYRVRDGPIPGTFRLSVLDNGVTSNEFWTIAGVAEDLSWVVFSYAGAASAVGQRYLGGLLCTKDGLLPPPSTLEKIWVILEKTSIAPWELFVVDNEDADVAKAGSPPLNFYRGQILNAKRAKGVL